MIRQPLLAQILVALAGMPLIAIAGCNSHTSSSVSTSAGATYVSSHVAAPVAAVLVKDQQVVEQGELLVQLDAQPLRAAFQREQAQLEIARAELEQTRAAARAQAAAAASAWSRVLAARNSVRENIARLHSAAANEKLRQSERTLAEKQYERAVEQAKQRQITPGEMDERRASLEVAKDQVEAAAAAVVAARAALGLNAASDASNVNAAEIERDSIGVKTAWYEFAKTVAELGYPLELDATKAMGEENPLGSTKDKKSFHEQLAQLATDAPTVRLAAAHVAQVEQQVRQAEIALAQVEIRAPVAGIVSSRAVNPGNLVEPGQTLFIIRTASESAETKPGTSKPAVESVGKAAVSP
jgi:membrane fusion protein (multidrug efflux system)